mmetsp:Transcript_4408/g.11043  ORF Transcript_4408/g.11043 Transcript_4408/m.11043 type:complete len:878 (+) Transcript_4408:1121-3754(+)
MMMVAMSSKSMIMTTTTTTTTTTITENENERPSTPISSSSSSAESNVVWDAYKSLIDDITTQPRVLQKVSKKRKQKQKQKPESHSEQVDEDDQHEDKHEDPYNETVERCKEFLLSSASSSSSASSLSEEYGDNERSAEEEEGRDDHDLRTMLKIREGQFLKRYNFTATSPRVEYDLISRCLSYFGDTCAKQQYNKRRKNNMTMENQTSNDDKDNENDDDGDVDQALLILIAWSKVKEMGLVPRENMLSTYLHILLDGLENNKNDFQVEDYCDFGNGDGEGKGMTHVETTSTTNKAAAIIAATMSEVISWHEELYKPNEKTTTLRIKSMIYQCDIEGAEQVLAALSSSPPPPPSSSVSSSTSAGTTSASENSNNNNSAAEDLVHNMNSNNDDQRKLRTFMPLLEYYAAADDAPSMLRIFRNMRQSSTTHIDCNAYSIILESLARGGLFRTDAPPILSLLDAESLLYNHTSGPLLLDQLLTEMTEDVLDVLPESAERIMNGFRRGFANRSESVDDVEQDGGSWVSSTSKITLGTVDIPATGICPLTGTALRLLSLDESQRQHVHDTLLEMARQQSFDFLSGNKNKGKKKNKIKKTNASANTKVQQPKISIPSTTVENEASHGYDELLKFSEWLDSRDGKPFTAIVDGPNIAYHGHPTVHYSTLKLVLDELESMGEVPLVVMPLKYTTPSFRTSGTLAQKLSDRELAMIEGLQAEGKMYVVPRFCLDDYYWMLASVSNQTTAKRNITEDVNVVPAAGKSDSDDNNHIGRGRRFPGMRPLLVTNDKMRDHKLDLLEPREFRRWCSCHIVNYKVEGFEKDEWIEERKVDLFPADAFSREIQGNMNGSNSGLVWHFPVSESTDISVSGEDTVSSSWLCLHVEQ